jgi:hypothetical protein
MLKIDVPDLAHPTAAHAVRHAIHVLEAQLAKPDFWIPQGENRIYFELMRDLPYRAEETSEPGTQILTNRSHKALGDGGRAGEGWSDYDKQANLHVRLSPAQVAQLASPLKPSAMFGKEDAPWTSRGNALAYLDRLKALAGFL